MQKVEFLQQKVVDLLVKNNADVNFVTDNRIEDTPLHFAVKKGNLGMVKYLLKQPGIHISVKNAKGITPLLSSVSTQMENYHDENESMQEVRIEIVDRLIT